MRTKALVGAGFRDKGLYGWKKAEEALKGREADRVFPPIPWSLLFRPSPESCILTLNPKP